MIRNYIKIAFRNLWRHKGFSLINIIGLAVGMTAFLLIVMYVRFELSYDNFHAKKNRVFRVSQDRFENGKLSTQWAGGAFAAASEFKKNFAEVEDYVKIVLTGGRHFLVKRTISVIENILSDHKFIRVHRSYIVSLSKISGYNALVVQIGQCEIPIGRLYKQSVMERLQSKGSA